MNTVISRLSGGAEDIGIFEAAGEIIRSGGLVAFPTETVYGLGGNGLDKNAAEKIYAAKGRPSDNPLIVHISEPCEAEKFAYTSEMYYKLAEAYMPGPLTVILPKRDNVPCSVTGGLNTVAVRCPGHAAARELIKRAGVPIAAPSANVSGAPSPTSAEHVVADLLGKIDMIIDGGVCDIGLESTVIALDGGKCIILRPGYVNEEMLLSVCDEVQVNRAVVDLSCVSEKAASPGMKYKHYSPKADVILVDAPDREAFIKYVVRNKRGKWAVICSDTEAEALDGGIILTTGEKYDTIEASKNFYSNLREADRMGAELIFSELPQPKGDELALFNRAIRASGGKIEKTL